MQERRGYPPRSRPTWPSTTVTNGLPDGKWTSFVISREEIAIGILLKSSLSPKKRSKYTSSTSLGKSAPAIARKRLRSVSAEGSFSSKLVEDFGRLIYALMPAMKTERRGPGCRGVLQAFGDWRAVPCSSKI